MYRRASMDQDKQRILMQVERKKFEAVEMQ